MSFTPYDVEQAEIVFQAAADKYHGLSRQKELAQHELEIARIQLRAAKENYPDIYRIYPRGD